MRPLPGRSVIAEFGSRFDADLARARLWESGLESVVMGDPAHGVAPHLVTERVFQLVVRDEVAEHAHSILTEDPWTDPEADELDAAFYQHRFADRPQWIRWSTWSLLLAVAGPVALTATFLVLWLVRGVFP